jgi:hypothetical protein
MKLRVTLFLPPISFARLNISLSLSLAIVLSVTSSFGMRMEAGTTLSTKASRVS